MSKCSYCHEDHDEISLKRHSLAHILAQAMQREVDRAVEVGIWPSIENGFYYDFLFAPDKQIKEEDLGKIQKQMEKITKENQQIKRLVFSPELSKKFVTQVMKQQYKEELRNEFASAGEEITFYINTISDKAKESVLRWISSEYISYYEKITDFIKKNFSDQIQDEFVVFVDMCEGPHIDNSKDIQAGTFKLDKLAGAYRRWNEKNVMMTRVYAVAFDTKDELKEYLTMMEEAKKRDHRRLGKELWLYTIDQNIWSGLILWKPKWAFIVNIIKRRFEDEQLNAWYLPVLTPHIGRKTLWETSGHWWFYNSGMFPPLELGQTLEDRQDNRKPTESETYLLKPMNCPFHMSIYTDDIHSYRELPLRYYEFGTVYRYEKKWELWWLTRVRWFTQDDAHIIVSTKWLKEEFGKVVDFAMYVLGTFGFKEINIYASFRDPSNKTKYLGSDDMRNMAENTIKEILENKKIGYKAEEWEAAFYGPKIDFKVKDAIWRSRQLSTVQFDFNLPTRFDMNFINEKWEQERPFVIHRALLGSLERFMWVLIENYSWAFPLRLAPEQIRIIPVADKFNDYANEIKALCDKALLRSSVDDSDDSFSKKIRNGEMMKVPYLVIVWEKEETENTVSVRVYKDKRQYEQPVSSFISEKLEEYKNRSL